MVSVRANVWVALALMLGLPTAVRAEELTGAEQATVTRAFEQERARRKTWASPFDQVVRLPGLSRPIRSTGTLWFRAPSALRLEFSKPPGDYVVIDGGRAHGRRKGRLFSQRSVDERPGPALLLNLFAEPAQSWERDFTVRMAREADRVIVQLAPREGRVADVAQIECQIDPATWDIRSCRVLTGDGATTEFIFKAPRRNVALAPGLFEMRELDAAGASDE